jgi:tetratricopeptide (TPR) repeat protein
LPACAGIAKLPASAGVANGLLAMMAAPSSRKDQPGAVEVRAQVERMTASDVFAKSPQLSAFLLFIVEAVVRGKGERLKGYTIGVEVLRRDISFDPQIDPIVRVEATRLRRAIERYYAGPGAADDIVIDLPRGGYVPRIRWREAIKSARPAGTVPAAQPADLARAAVSNGLPTLRIAPFVVIGVPDTRFFAAEVLASRLSEAFALFDWINVVAAAAPGRRSDYRLDGTVEYRGEETVDLRFRLIDESDATVIWSRSFEKMSGKEDDGIERHLIRQLANAVVQPFGVIWARDRGRQLAMLGGDPRYVCMIDAAEVIKSFDPAGNARIRGEIEELMKVYPGFAAGYSYLAIVYAREYLFGSGRRPGDSPPLDRALDAARKGIELRPQSARAYHAMSAVLFYRREIEAGIAAAETAMSLNPYDLLTVCDYGGRLIASGQIDKGMALLLEMTGVGAVLPSWIHFFLFVGHYMRDDLAAARYHAGQLTSTTHVFGHMARALIAVRDNKVDEARQLIRLIFALQPAWKSDPRHEIGKLLIDQAIVERLSGELEAAGLLQGG